MENHSGNTGFENLVEESRFEVKVHRSGMAMETLWDYVSIVFEDVQNLEDLQGNNWTQR